MDEKIDFHGHGLQALGSVDFSDDALAFTITAGVNNEFSFTVLYPFNSHGPGADEAHVRILYHADHAESNVKPIIFDGKTVGWLCTVGALCSKDHDYYENKHFRRAAYAATHALLLRGDYTKRIPVINNQEFRVSDLFEEEQSLIILHCPSVGDRLGPRFRMALPCLHRYGFVPAEGGAGDVSFRTAPVDLCGAVGKNFKLEIPSVDLGFDDFIEQVFSRLLPSADTPLLGFFLYYQLIEMMMAKVFAHRQSCTIEEMQSVKGDPFRIRPLFDRLKEDMAEKKRIKLLFGDYTGVSRDAVELMQFCNGFLRVCGVGEECSPEAALYQVRNVIFHGMRAVPAAAFDSLNEIVGQLAIIVPELLIAFSLPEAVTAEEVKMEVLEAEVVEG
ncbi:hypothetical protein [Stenotrophomonas maltophilia]|uniref:hypothetical protein n=1 Tax=Stenotrophomonas maltophilia TaxID=40324 RepID=UPI0039C2B387